MDREPGALGQQLRLSGPHDDPSLPPSRFNMGSSYVFLCLRSKLNFVKRDQTLFERVDDCLRAVG